MGLHLELVNVGFCVLFLGWILIDLLRRRRKIDCGVVGESGDAHLGKFWEFYVFTVGFSGLISILYLGFGFYEYRISIDCKNSIFTGMAWVLGTVIVVCSRNRNKNWPWVLILWWVYSCIFGAFCVSLNLINHFKSVAPYVVLEVKIVDFASLPLLIILCFSALSSRVSSSSDHQNGLERPLLEKEDGDSSSFANAGIWSQLLFRWLNPLFKTGWVQKLDLLHIPAVPRSETAESASSLLEESLLEQEFKASSLRWGVICAVWRSLSINAVFAGLNTIASYTGPFLITYFVSLLSSKHDASRYQHGLVLAFVFLLSKTVESLSQRQWYFGAERIGIRVRAALMVLVYKKSVSIKYDSPSNANITNLIDVDVERIGDFFMHIHGVWLFPLQVFLALAILYKNLGAAPSLSALFSTVLVIFSNTPLARRQKRLHARIMEAKDSRMEATSETLKGIRVLKLHSWEAAFLGRILELREAERGWLGKYLYVSSVVTFLFWVSPTVVSIITFGVCIAVKTPLTTGTVLSALATFRVLQEPIYSLPGLVAMISQTRVSVDRLEEFIGALDQKGHEKQERKQCGTVNNCSGSDTMLEVEKGEYALETSNLIKPSIKISNKISIEGFPGFRAGSVGFVMRGEQCGTVNNCSDTMLEIEKGEYAWETQTSDPTKPAIKISNKISIRAGQKVAICGSVGSGKSSLLSSVLGEMPILSGSPIRVYGSKAYVPQSAWIQTGTIRENVLFGKEMNNSLYHNVLLGCALNRDIESWADGDMSIVGERGINLSGGQKQRIQLARAVYSDSDVYVLDDPFSAVDAHTGAHLYKKCIRQLLVNKTVIYTTHQLEFLSSADLVLVMKDGEIVQCGKYEELIAETNGELVMHITAHTKSLNQVNNTSQETNSSSSNSRQIDSNRVVLAEEKPEEPEARNPNLEEEAETGRVKWSVYSKFITSAYRGALVPIVVTFHVLFQGLQIGSNYWMAWATSEAVKVSKERLMWIFVLLSGGSSFFILGRAVLLATISLETARRLFDDMINSVFRAPISFFDSTPSSRILSRCSKDQNTVDTDIPYRVAGLVFALIQLLSVIVLMSKVAWQIFPLFVVVFVISIWYQAYYITTARELARMVGIRKAPILHHFSESVAGAPTIRCFGQEERFLVKVMNLIDDYSRVAFHNAATMEWLCARINFLFNIGFFLALVILVSLPESALDPSLAGLAATYGLNLNVLQAWVIWNVCNVENKMISVERVLQFSNLPSEAPFVIQNCRPDPEWPSNGHVQLQGLHVRYKPNLPMVLRGVTCDFPGGKRVGVVGRTGSGKSTLIQALFRVVEPSGGRILIDGLDIAMIGLQDLRSGLGIIPQDPTLFRGTMRTNVDPFGQHSDHEIWEVLRKCHLVEMIRQDQRLLDAPVTEDGENWSVGQRQLVCLARVLLKKRRILVLDEATASVDTATDNLIQKTIREETGECTVITVAHRIATVIDNDLVLVLEEGKIVEYDTPAQLLNDSSSAFSKLVREFLKRSSEGQNQVQEP